MWSLYFLVLLDAFKAFVRCGVFGTDRYGVRHRRLYPWLDFDHPITQASARGGPRFLFSPLVCTPGSLIVAPPFSSTLDSWGIGSCSLPTCQRRLVQDRGPWTGWPAPDSTATLACALRPVPAARPPDDGPLSCPTRGWQETFQRMLNTVAAGVRPLVAAAEDGVLPCVACINSSKMREPAWPNPFPTQLSHKLPRFSLSTVIRLSFGAHDRLPDPKTTL